MVSLDLMLDTRQEKPHHLYEIDSGKIEDYFDDELNSILEEYFRNKNNSRI